MPLIVREGVTDMVTWEELFAFCMVIVAIVSLVIQIHDDKK